MDTTSGLNFSTYGKQSLQSVWRGGHGGSGGKERVKQ